MILGFGGQWTDHRQAPKVFVTPSSCVPMLGWRKGVGPTAIGEVETGTR